MFLSVRRGELVPRWIISLLENDERQSSAFTGGIHIIESRAGTSPFSYNTKKKNTAQQLHGWTEGLRRVQNDASVNGISN